MVCKHCANKAEWRWSDADGNEESFICERCMDTVSAYMYAPLWQFEVLKDSALPPPQTGRE